jgi:hypothetical protein
LGQQGTQGPTGFIEVPDNTYTLPGTKVRISSLFAYSTDLLPGSTSDGVTGLDYYYNPDIQWDPINGISTFLRFAEKIYYAGGPTSATSGGPWTINTDNGTIQLVDLTNATTGTTKYFDFVHPLNDNTGYNPTLSFILMIIGGGNPALTIQWPSGMKWEADLGAPSLGSTQQVSVIPFTYVLGEDLPTGIGGWYGGADLKYDL